MTKDEKGGFSGAFAGLFEEQEKRSGKRPRAPRIGEAVVGMVVAIGRDAVFIGLDGKSEGVLERAALTGKDGVLTVKVGDTVRAHIVAMKDGQAVLRTRLGDGENALEELAQAFENGAPVAGKVTGVNKGGVEVQVGRVRAFCPMSQLEVGFVEDVQAFVGRELEFRVTKLERGQGGAPNVVVSRRALLEAERAQKAAEIRAGLSVGAIVRGPITRIKEFGAFVDLGGIEALLHVSQIGFARVGHPSEALSVGDVVEAEITKIEPSLDPKKPDRISLSLKSLATDPLIEASGKLGRGTRHSGKVVRLEAFGAIIALEGGFEGMVHVSELQSDRRVQHAREVLSVGQDVEVVVLEIDTARRRLSLSMKQVAALREAADAAAFQRPAAVSLGTFGELFAKKLGR
ncbi:MAG: S1 RNA-binding domain-containing protein [Myxococcales bacterium]|nr:S1 RNA-binding domain-containing protein [Myxococcales bacterium]